MKKQITAVLLAAAILTASLPVFAQDTALSRGDAAQMLLTAADDYNPDVKKEDIIKGYEDGELHEERGVNRAEALVMLKRSFGQLPAPSGHNKRTALTADNFSDLPDWAVTELNDVFDAGIAAGTGEGIFSPYEPVTAEQMKLFISRVYALFGTNERDDFYAAVNKDALEKLEIEPGRSDAGTLSDIGETVNSQLISLINEIAESSNENGTPEKKIADLYNTVADKESRNKDGIAPVKPYLEMIDNAKTISDLTKLNEKLGGELCVYPFVGFAVTEDSKDSTKYKLAFGSMYPMQSKDFYENEDASQKAAYTNYLKTMLVLGGETEEKAAADTESYYAFEKELSQAMLNVEDMYDVDKTYNIYGMEDIKKLYPDFDMQSLLNTSGLKEEDEIIVSDKGTTEKFAELFNGDNLEVLKTAAKLNVLIGYGNVLNDEFTAAAEEYSSALLGTEGTYSDEEKNIGAVVSLLPEYADRLYAQQYFSPEAKADVEKMVNDIITVFEKRIDKLEWMSAETKVKAKSKLSKIKVKVGYPDEYDSEDFDSIEIKSVKDGGSYFENVCNIMHYRAKEAASLQGTENDHSDWVMNSFIVNACYDPGANDITFPAGILQSPLYDINASYEENLGGIGYIIAHEITHAFDNNGAKYDENGNAADWWTEKDYDEFQNLCAKMTDFYDGKEAAPGIAANGARTLSENVADNGAVQCITEIVSELENPDYSALYRSIARTWLQTSSREYAQYLNQIDTHSAAKLRVNMPVENCEEFYKTFNVGENDGMYVAPQNRVVIW